MAKSFWIGEYLLVINMAGLVIQNLNTQLHTKKTAIIIPISFVCKMIRKRWNENE